MIECIDLYSQNKLRSRWQIPALLMSTCKFSLDHHIETGTNMNACLEQALPSQEHHRTSIAVSRTPAAHHQRSRDLHLHLDGNAINFYLRLSKAPRNGKITHYKNYAMQKQIKEGTLSLNYSQENLTL